MAGERELPSLTGHTDGIFSVTFSPNSQWLISGSFDGTTRVWKADTRDLRRR